MTGLGIDWTGRFRRVSPIARLPAMVSFLSPKPALSLDGGNRFSCPIAAIRNILRIGPVGGKRWPVFGRAIQTQDPSPAGSFAVSDLF